MVKWRLFQSALFVVACSARPTPEPQLSVLLITVDTLRADEGFNITNAKNPAGFVASQASALFGKPQAFAGDFQRGEQRLFQLGVRFEF